MRANQDWPEVVVNRQKDREHLAPGLRGSKAPAPPLQKPGDKDEASTGMSRVEAG